jgi:hypothetical protein
MKMKKIIFQSSIAWVLAALFVLTGCSDRLDIFPENTERTITTDYSKSEDMILPLIGVYERFYTDRWTIFPLVSVLGDDVNAGGLGDQIPFSDTDRFAYDKDYWMYDATWRDAYETSTRALSAIYQLELYREAALDPADQARADQYISEARVMHAWTQLNIARLWGALVIPTTRFPSDLEFEPLLNREETLMHIIGLCDESLDHLPATHPAQRTDVTGGITKFSALAIKALAYQELENYQEVADATAEIINSGMFSLEPVFDDLFRKQGKLSTENVLEWQYSDFGTETGVSKSYLYAFFGPQSWTPVVETAEVGWGFWEPSLKYIKFMLDRGEQIRLQTSVLFTDRGIAEIKKDPNYATLPAWISNTTTYGDIINDYERALFASGKHYLPSTQLTPGRTNYGSGKNFILVRYSEILLMYAEAVTHGASGTALTPLDAVNTVRQRAGLADLSALTIDDIIDEKFAEFAMEWGTRYRDMVRLKKYDELSYEGRVFTEDKIYLPYPQARVDALDQLAGN